MKFKSISKLTLFAALLCGGASAAWADTTIVGNTDNSTGWWSAFSSYYTIEPNMTRTINFVNHSAKDANAHNWIIAVTTDADRNGDGYSEYVVLRADNYAWQTGDYVDGVKKYNKNTGDESEPTVVDNETTVWGNTHNWYTSLSSNYNWTTFLDDMDGSSVVMKVKRIGKTVTIRADITKSEKSYYEEFVINCGDGTQNIRAFLTTEKGHLVIENESAVVNSINTDYISSFKGDLTQLVNGTFDTDANGWTNIGTWWSAADWRTRSWRGTAVNGFAERTSDGAMTYTLKNMPEGTYKVVAAARAYTDGVIQAEIAGTTGSSITGVGDSRVNDNPEINTNGVEMPYSSLGGFTTENLGHNWRWITATGVLNEAGNLVINFNCTGTSWMAIDDVHLYYVSDAYDEHAATTTYCMTLGTVSASKLFSNSGKTTTCDLIVSNPNAIIRAQSEIVTATDEWMNNMYINSGGKVMNKMVLYDGFDYTDYSTNADEAFRITNGATLYRTLAAETWSTLVVPFCPTNLNAVKVPTAYADGTVTFGDATLKDLNNVPLLVKSTAGTNVITGSRNGTYGTGFGTNPTVIGDLSWNGIYTGGNVPTSTESAKNYVVGPDNKLHKVTGTGVTIAPFRAYFTLANAQGAPAFINLNFDDETTGVNMVYDSGLKVQNEYFDLQGRKVANPTKGLYIVNGKKVVIK